MDHWTISIDKTIIIKYIIDDIPTPYDRFSSELELLFYDPVDTVCRYSVGNLV